jgi:uncharacterized protein YggE
MAPAPAGEPKSANAQPQAVNLPPKLPQGFYKASNNVEVTIRNLDQAGKIISVATSAGADQVFGIRFEIEDPAPLLAKARQEAVIDARNRAERLAQLAGVKLGSPVSISEQDGAGPSPMPVFAMRRKEAAPIERGELEVTTSVQIVFALGE